MTMKTYIERRNKMGNQYTIIKSSEKRAEIVYCNLFLGESYKSLAKRLRLTKGTVKRIVRQVIEEGNKQIEEIKKKGD